MHFIVVDDEKLSLSFFANVCEEIQPQHKISYFLSPAEAVAYVQKHPDTDIAFLDIEMPELNGIELAVRLRQVSPDIRIVFITGHDHYARQAFAVHANGFVSKPFDADEIKQEIANIQRMQQTIQAQTTPQIWVQTFGHFQVFVNGRPVIFSSGKAQELLAYLVDRHGSCVTADQAISILWEDSSYDIAAQNRFRKTVRSLKLTLEEYGAMALFNNGRNSKSVNLNAFCCDYYDFLAGKPEAEKAFMGEYLSNYTWAEPTLAILLQKQPLLFDEFQ
ncbi:MAG: response regulator [Anaerotruncus sp.]|nr:response regulator [Anaerotruncus sp.]